MGHAIGGEKASGTKNVKLGKETRELMDGFSERLLIKRQREDEGEALDEEHTSKRYQIDCSLHDKEEEEQDGSGDQEMAENATGNNAGVAGLVLPQITP